MEGAEQFYRNLCSLETVRSGKSGFFRDFGEHVSGIAGETWISEVFGRIRDDEARVRVLFADEKIKEAVTETLDRTTMLYRAKDAEASRARRLEALEAAAKGEREKAVLLFSQAVLRAPPTGKCEAVDDGLSLPLALLGRAETFVALNEHALALEDFALIEEEEEEEKKKKKEEEFEFPERFRVELARKRADCEKRYIPSEKEEEQTSSKSHELSGGPHPEMPTASALLDVRETATAGKQAIATGEIGPGDTLAVEPPLAACLLPEFFGTRCHHCFAGLRGPVGCPDCSSVAFCGRTCRDEATASYHKYECRILALLIGNEHRAYHREPSRPDPLFLLVTRCASFCEVRLGNERSEHARSANGRPVGPDRVRARLSRAARSKLRGSDAEIEGGRSRRSCGNDNGNGNANEARQVRETANQKKDIARLEIPKGETVRGNRPSSLRAGHARGPENGQRLFREIADGSVPLEMFTDGRLLRRLESIEGVDGADGADRTGDRGGCSAAETSSVVAVQRSRGLRNSTGQGTSVSRQQTRLHRGGDLPDRGPIQSRLLSRGNEILRRPKHRDSSDAQLASRGHGRRELRADLHQKEPGGTPENLGRQILVRVRVHGLPRELAPLRRLDQRARAAEMPHGRMREAPSAARTSRGDGRPDRVLGLSSDDRLAGTARRSARMRASVRARIRGDGPGTIRRGVGSVPRGSENVSPNSGAAAQGHAFGGNRGERVHVARFDPARVETRTVSIYRLDSGRRPVPGEREKTTRFEETESQTTFGSSILRFFWHLFFIMHMFREKIKFHI